MVRRVIEVRDLLSSQSLSDRLGAALAHVGIQTVDPTGQAFDPAAHHAVDVAPTTNPSAVGLVADTERVGYLRRGVVLRVGGRRVQGRAMRPALRPKPGAR